MASGAPVGRFRPVCHLYSSSSSVGPGSWVTAAPTRVGWSSSSGSPSPSSARSSSPVGRPLAVLVAILEPRRALGAYARRLIVLVGDGLIVVVRLGRRVGADLGR